MKIGKTIKINIRIKSICNKGLLALAFVALVLTSATCLLYTSDAADERSSVDLGGRRIIKKKNKQQQWG